MTGKILILAGDTDGNLGDLAIMEATCGQFQRIAGAVEITIPTSQPARDRRRLGIIPVRRGWRGFLPLARAVRATDLVICGGGGLFQDDDSLVKMPYWAIRLLMVRLLGGRVAGLCIGAGPLDHPVSKWFAKLALRQLESISVRDGRAHAVLAPLTEKPVAIIPDPAFLLPPAPRDHAIEILRESKIPLDGTPLVGVSIRRWFHKQSSVLPYKYAAKFGLLKDRGRTEMSTLVTLVASALRQVVEQTNAHIVFMPTYNVEHEDDRQVCQQVASELAAGTCTILTFDDPRLYKAVTGCLSVMLCGRMHPGILAAGMGTPIVGLSYNSKFDGMFALLGMQSRCLSYTELVQHKQSGRITDMLRTSIQDRASYQPDTAEIEVQVRQYINSLAGPVLNALET